MLKGAFFFGGRGEAPYPEVTKIVVEKGINYVMWGKEVPAGFTQTHKNICEAPNYHKNKFDFSKFTKIGPWNFNSFSTYLIDRNMTKIDLSNLETLGSNCFHNLSGDIKKLVAPQIQTMTSCFTGNSLNEIEMPGLEELGGNCFSNISGHINDLPFHNLRRITGSDCFCNIYNLYFLTLRKLEKIAPDNFKNLNSLSQIVVNVAIDSNSEKNLRAYVNSGKIRKISR